jgi:hypothetical protein
VHLLKLLGLYNVIEEGIVTEERELQPVKTFPPNLSKDSGKTIFFKDTHPTKAEVPNRVKLSKFVINERDVQCSKAPASIVLIFFDKTISFIFSHPEKAPANIFVVLLLKLTTEREEHPSKDLLPIIDTESGIVIDDIALQF